MMLLVISLVGTVYVNRCVIIVVFTDNRSNHEDH